MTRTGTDAPPGSGPAPADPREARSTRAALCLLALSLLLGWTIFLWGRSLFGARGALLALALYVLDPNVVAHSGLVTTDLGVTLFIFLTLHALWRWSVRPSPARLALLGLSLGA